MKTSTYIITTECRWKYIILYGIIPNSITGFIILTKTDMTQTLEQAIEANKLELDRLTAIYTEISEYAKQKHGISLFELECAIEQADHLDNMLNNPSIDENFYYE